MPADVDVMGPAEVEFRGAIICPR